MKLTNKNGLPEAIFRAVNKQKHEKNGYSVSELLQPIQLTVLKHRHEEKIEEDVSDRIWALFGSSLHYVLAQNSDENALSEEYITFEKAGAKVSGTFDYYENEVLYDFKVTSAYSIIYGDRKSDWGQQLNMYRCLLESKGFKVKELKIVAFLRDWSKSKALQGGDYPDNNVMIIPIDIDRSITLDAMISRAAEIEGYKDAEELPPCTPTDTWEKPTVYAVMKKGRKSAIKLYSDKKEADERAEKEKGYVEIRQGEKVRCKEYCPVNKFCKQYKEYTEIK